MALVLVALAGGPGARAQSGADAAPWTLLTPALQTRVEAPGVAVGGKLYVFAGFKDADLRITGSVEAYDPQTNAWTARAPMPRPVTHVGAAVVGREVWFAGGFAGDNPGSAISAVQVYDTETNTWRDGPRLPARRASGTLAAVGRTLHYIGGLLPDRETDVDDHYVLDLDRLQSGWTSAAPLPIPRNHLSSAVIGGRVYAIGGQQGHDESRRFRSELHVYDPATDTWTRRADLPVRRSHFEPGTTLWEGRILIVGGVGRGAENNRAMNQITAYDPATDTWTELDPLPVRLLGPVAQAIGGRLIVTHGGLDRTENPQNVAWSRPLDSPSGGFIGEAGRVTVKQDGASVWHAVAFARPYTAPVVVAGPVSAGGSDPVTVRVRNVTPTGFELQLDEWDYLDGRHTEETVSWLAVERGVHRLDGGGRIEAGLVGAGEAVKTYGLAAGFPTAPVVFSQVVTVADGRAVVTRQRNVAPGSFQLRLQGQEADPGHGAETVAYVAVEVGGVAGVLAAGRTPDAVQDPFYAVPLATGFSSPPVLLATMQTFDGSDPATLRYRSLTATRFEVRVEEEGSADAETEHTSEVVGYVALPPGGLRGTTLGGAFMAPASGVASASLDADALRPAEPVGYVLEAVSPNPFRSHAVIRYALPEAADVRLEVFDALGHRVAVLVEGRVEAGHHTARFDAMGMASGVYVCRLQAGAFSGTRRVTVLR